MRRNTRESGEQGPEEDMASPRALAIAKRHFGERERVQDVFDEHFMVEPSALPGEIGDVLESTLARVIDGFIQDEGQISLQTVTDRMLATVNQSKAQEALALDFEGSNVPKLHPYVRIVMADGDVYTPGYASVTGLVAMS